MDTSSSYATAGEEAARAAELQAAFRAIDANGDGSLSPSELKLVMRSVTWAQHCTEDELDEMIQEVDTDHDGSVSYEEFVGVLTRRPVAVNDDGQRGSARHVLELSIDHTNREWTRKEKICAVSLLGTVTAIGLILITSAVQYFIASYPEMTPEFMPLGSLGAVVGITIATYLCVVLAAIAVSLRLHKDFVNLQQAASIESLPFQAVCTFTIVTACYWWIATNEATVVVHARACGEGTLMLRGTKAINWTCVETCDGMHIRRSQIRQQTNDWSTSNSAKAIALGAPANVSAGCNPWFEPDLTETAWYLASEASILCAMLTHLFVKASIATYSGVIGVLRGKLTFWFLLKPLVLCDLSLILAVLGGAVPFDSPYSTYSVLGVTRFLSLFHAIIPLEVFLERQKRSMHKVWSARKFRMVNTGIGLLVFSKLTFVILTGAALIFAAEKPCEAVLDDLLNKQGRCDPAFNSFASTVYFIFVTVSTVGYGDMSPKTPLGQVLIVLVIIFAISYLPSAISEALDTINARPERPGERPDDSVRADSSHIDKLHARFDKINQHLEALHGRVSGGGVRSANDGGASSPTQYSGFQVGWMMHAGTLRRRRRSSYQPPQKDADGERLSPLPQSRLSMMLGQTKALNQAKETDEAAAGFQNLSEYLEAAAHGLACATEKKKLVAACKELGISLLKPESQMDARNVAGVLVKAVFKLGGADSSRSKGNDCESETAPKQLEQVFEVVDSSEEEA